MRLRSIFLIALFLASALFAAIPAASHDGDVLRNGAGVQQHPGNPCQSQGAAGLVGGVGVDEANGRLYYAVTDKNLVFRTSTTSPFGCQQVATAPTPVGVGFTRMAFDPFHNGANGLLWAAPADQSGTVLGMDPVTWATVATINWPAGAGRDVVGLAVGEQGGNLIHVVWSGDQLAERFTDQGVAAGAIALQGVQSAVRSVSGFADQLVTGESNWLFKHHSLSGADLNRAYRPHRDYQDEFWQDQMSFYYWGEDTAIDETTYAGQGVIGIFMSFQTQYNVCVAECPQWVCIVWGPEGCLEYERTCPTESCGIYELRQFPNLRGFHAEVCGLPGFPPCEECNPEPMQIQRALPLDNAYVLSQDTGTYVGLPLMVQSNMPLYFEDPNGHTDKTWTVSGPVPGLPLTVTGNAVNTVLPTAGMAPGIYPITVTLSHTASNCTPDETYEFEFQVADPYLATRAQNLRVEGNLPADVIAGTIRQEPLNHLIGKEQLHVGSGHVQQVNAQIDVIEALAEHGPVAGSEWLAAAHADTDAIDVRYLSPQGICTALTQSAVCASLPGSVPARLLHTQADASVDMLTGGVGTASSYVENAGLSTASSPDCGQTVATISIGPISIAPLPTIPPVFATVVCPQVINGPGFTLYINEDWTNTGPGYAEAYANILRLEIDQHPFRGRVVIGESYSAATLVGTSVLQGPPGGLDVQDDFDTGGDAPSSLGPVLADGLYSGQFQGQDTMDAFQVAANPGDKLRVALSPSHRVQSELATAPTPPSGQTTPRLIQMDLLDASGVVRDSTTLGFPALADARPSIVELNVDGPGPWRVELSRQDWGVERSPYTVAVSTQPVVLLPGDGVPPAGDAPDACPSAWTAQPTQVGMLDQNDPADVYQFTAAGQTTVVQLAMPDLGGADFDLSILDSTCNVVASSTAGKAAPEPKGIAEVVTLAPGTYYAVVERFSGIGNYELTIRPLGP